MLEAVKLPDGRQAIGELGFAYPVQQPHNKNDSLGGLDLDDSPTEIWLPWEENEGKVNISLYDSRANSSPGATSATIISANNDVPFGVVECS